MLNAVALLPSSHLDKIDEAYSLFSRTMPQAKSRDDPVSEAAWTKLFADLEDFRGKNKCERITIDFIGCWFVPLHSLLIQTMPHTV